MPRSVDFAGRFDDVVTTRALAYRKFMPRAAAASLPMTISDEIIASAIYNTEEFARLSEPMPPRVSRAAFCQPYACLSPR